MLKGAISMTIYYLYVKTHRITGLNYLGYTSKLDPHKYTGSGTRWNLHLQKHGYLYDTKILHRCISKSAIRAWGLFYSRLWSVVNSKKWANLKEENGDGGAMLHTDESNKKRSNTMKGRVFTDEHKQKLSAAGKGHPDTRSPESLASFKEKASLKLRGKKKPEGFGEAVGDRLRGTKMSDESKAKMKTKWTSERKAEQSKRMVLQNQTRPKIVCPQCQFIGTNPSNMKRYHFTNCKSPFPAKPKKSTGKLKHNRQSCWIFMSPDFIIHTVVNLRQFCRSQNLNNGSMCEVASGNRKTHKGWRLA